MAKNMVLDTNFVLALFDQESVYNPLAIARLEQDGDIELLIPQIVVFELLVGEKEGEDIVGFCKMLVDGFISNNKKDFEIIRSINPEDRRKLKANDCMIFALCKRYGAKLFTFDKKLAAIVNSKG